MANLPTNPFVVKGKVCRPNGDPVPGVIVSAVDVDIRSEQQLGTCVVGADGKYEIRYSEKQFDRAGVKSADIKLYVYDNEKSKTPRAKTEIFWNAPKECNMDVVVGGEVEVGPSEFNKLAEVIPPVLDGLTPEEIVEDDKHQDITFLENETGFPRYQVQFFVTAFQAERKIREKNFAEVFYGLYRGGVSADLPTLLSTEPPLLRKALDTSMKGNVIRARSNLEVELFIETLRKASVAQSTGDANKPTPISAVLGTVLKTPKLFIENLSKFDGDSEGFWKKLSVQEEFKDKIPKTQLAVQLGILTLNHAPLIEKLQSRNVSDFSDLTDIPVSEWEKILKAPGMSVPPEIPGDSQDEKIDNYASTLANMVEDTYPSKFFAKRIAQDEQSQNTSAFAAAAEVPVPRFPAQKQIATFLGKNSTFDLTKVRLNEFLDKNPRSMDGLLDPELVKRTIRSIQRIHAVAPRYELTKALVSDGILSSLQISRMGQSAFLTQYSGVLGGQREALSVFDRAEQAHATAFALISKYGWAGSRFTRIPAFTEPVIESTTTDTGIPDLSTLFGSLDMCSCEECKSTDGPAAYLVDTLNYLNDRKLITAVVRDPRDGTIASVTFRTKRDPRTRRDVPMSVKDALFERRPDIGEIELNCQNTNTPLPYIDLTIEVLENAVAPFPPFEAKDLTGQNIAEALDSKTVSPELRGSFNPPLTQYAQITVMKTGAWWYVDEPAFTYTIRKDEGSPLRVVSRNTQTKGTAADRLANPQYVNAAAYAPLRDTLYPWTLPFDLWAFTVRTYLAHVDVRRWGVMETLIPTGNRLAVLESPDIAYERLGLTPFEGSLVTTAEAAEPWKSWGLKRETLGSDNWIPDPADKSLLITSGLWRSVLLDRVDVFLHQSGLSYKELLNMIQLSSTLGVSEGEIEIVARKGAPVDTCQLNLLQLRNFGSGIKVFEELVRFGRLLRRLDGWRVLDLGKAIRMIRSRPLPAGTELKALAVALSHILRLRDLLPDLELEVVLALVGETLDTTPYRDYENDDEDADTSSFYARTFRNRTVVDRVDTVFTDDPGTLTGKIKDHVSTITSAIYIGPVDFANLSGSVLGEDPALTLQNLSVLYRHNVLAQAFGISMDEYLILLKLYPVDDVFASTSQIVLFVERSKSLLASQFSFSEMNYLLRHDFPPDNNPAPQDETIVNTLSDIRTSLQQIGVDNTFTDEMVDADGEITQKRLGAGGWDPKLVGQIVATFKDAVPWTVSVATPVATETLAGIPAELKDRVSYDDSEPTALRLSYAGVMTKADQAALKGINNASDEFKDAVDRLFEAARTFFKRNMRTVAVQHYVQPLSAMPAGVKIPAAVKKKLYFDSTTQTLHAIGALTDAELTTVLAGTDATTDTDYRTAVNNLYAAAEAPLTPAQSADAFLTEDDVKDLFDSAVTAAGESNTPLRRFTVLLQKLLPRLKYILGQRHIIQKLAEFLSLEAQVVEPLMSTWMSHSGQSLVSVVSSDSFVSSNANSKISRTAFKDQFVALNKLAKVAMISQRLRLTGQQLTWLFEFRRVPSDPAAGWLDLNALPVELLENGDFAGFERLLALVKLRDNSSFGERNLNAIFTLARQDGVTMDALWAEVSIRTKWPKSELTALGAAGAFNLVNARDLQDEVALLRLSDALALLQKIGCSAADGLKYAKTDQTEEQARSIVQTVKSKYDISLWQTVARPLRNILRDKQRKSLVDYMLFHQPEGIRPVWRSADDLYAHYLMDVEMGPCQLTSRIKQAISIAQLFVQRCLMNLEPNVRANEEYDTKWEEWKHRKNFRVSGAAKQVFQRPENFLEGNVRDDRTEMFKDLETDLKQEDLTPEVAEKAYMGYLEKLDAVANLQPVSYCHEEERDLTGHVAKDVLHVFACTRATPAIYYYRKLIDGFTWTAWEKVNADVSGPHVIPVVWRRRIHLFWAIINEKQEKAPLLLPSGTTPLTDGDTYWEIKLGWTEKKEGKWQAKTITDSFIRCRKSGAGGVFDEPTAKKAPGRSLLTFKAITDPGNPSLSIKCLQNKANFCLVGYFYFDGVRSNPRAITCVDDEPWRGSMGDLYLMAPTNTTIRGMSFAEDESKGSNGRYVSDGKVWVYTANFPQGPLDQTQEKLSKNKTQVAVLGSTPLTYSLVYPHQDAQFSCQKPFFFCHGTRSFFVRPSDLVYWIPVGIGLGIRDMVNPALMDGALWDKYLRKPLIPEFNRPYPAPDITGHRVGRPTFEVGGALAGMTGPLKKTVFAQLAAADVTTRALGIIPKVNFSLEDVFQAAPRRFKPGYQIDASRFKIPATTLAPYRSKRFKFELFYHPFMAEFIRQINRHGVQGLLQRTTQMSKQVFFESTFDPNKFYVRKDEYPDDEVDFDNGPMSIYNWELFYHIPLLIAESLGKNQKFEEAQKWFHYIFDPTDTSSLPSPQKFWRTKPFFETEKPGYAEEAISNLLRFLAKKGNAEEYEKLTPDERRRVDELIEGVHRWRKDPFNPFLIARMRTTAFQKSVVMKYLDNLIAWGDNLFRRDTIESINEATQIFMLAAAILGERPAEIPARAAPKMQTYNTIEPLIDETGNALVEVESLAPISPPTGREPVISTTNQIQTATSTMLFFCVPRNDKLLRYWDVVADRLFKIRNCMNLQGVVRELALFEPPIDPAMLIRAAAAGIDLSSVLNDASAPLPYHRYVVMAAKAMDVCNELRTLGQAILSALEKKDAEQMALIRSTHERDTLTAARLVRQKNIEEAGAALEAARLGRTVVNERYNYYSNIPFLTPWEWTYIGMEGASLALSIIEAATQPVTAALALIPEIKVGSPASMGATYGGQNLSYSGSYFGAFLSRASGLLSKGAGMADKMAAFYRRSDDWAHQARLAAAELNQFDKQIAGADVRVKIQEQELKNHDLQIKQNENMEDFMRSKFANVDLYDWMLGQLATVYFQSYQLAYDIAKKAERAYAYELGLTGPANMIQFGYWDSMKKGLLAGEKLAYSLRNMDASYAALDRREYEIAKNVSLLQLDPIAVIQLKETGACTVGIPEALFDLDYPGHYFRRLKAVSVTVPCVVGPHAAVPCTLTLLKSTVRTSPFLAGGVYRRASNRADPRFADLYANAQDCIATSTAQADGGLFESALRDERYLPFERAGAISSWSLQLAPPEIAPFDYATIQDVVLGLRYTAREAGEPLRSAAVAELQKSALDAIKTANAGTGLARMFSLRHEFPDAWFKMLAPLPSGGDDDEAPPPAQTGTLSLAFPSRFPFFLRGAKKFAFTRFEVFVRVRDEFRRGTHAAGEFLLRVREAAAPRGTPDEPLALAEFKGTLRGAKTLPGQGGKPGDYVVTVGLRSGEPVLREAVEEIMLVVFFKAGW